MTALPIVLTAEYDEDWSDYEPDERSSSVVIRCFGTEVGRIHCNPAWPDRQQEEVEYAVQRFFSDLLKQTEDNR